MNAIKPFINPLLKFETVSVVCSYDIKWFLRFSNLVANFNPNLRTSDSYCFKGVIERFSMRSVSPISRHLQFLYRDSYLFLSLDVCTLFI